MTDRAVIGDSPRRREDARFVTGHGVYLDDLHFDGVAHAVFLRSPHVHARIKAIATGNALGCDEPDGTVSLITGTQTIGPRPSAKVTRP